VLASRPSIVDSEPPVTRPITLSVTPVKLEVKVALSPVLMLNVEKL